MYNDNFKSKGYYLNEVSSEKGGGGEIVLFRTMCDCQLYAEVGASASLML
jgi:hypothetical protein